MQLGAQCSDQFPKTELSKYISGTTDPKSPSGALTAKKTSLEGSGKIGVFSDVAPALQYSTCSTVYTEYMTYCTHAQYKALQLLKADIAIGVLMNKYGLCIWELQY